MAIARTSYELTAAKQIRVGSGILTRVSIKTNGTDNATVILYDVAAAGDIAVTNKLEEITVLGANHYGGFDWSHPVKYTAGLYCTVTGTGASYIVEYKK